MKKSYGILMRISDRIESLDGYEKAKNILVVGWLENSESYSVNFPPEIVGTTDGLIIRHDDEVVGQSVLTSALNDYSNISLDFLSGDTAKELKNTERVKSMPCFPADGSVDMIGGHRCGEAVRGNRLIKEERAVKRSLRYIFAPTISALTGKAATALPNVKTAS